MTLESLNYSLHIVRRNWVVYRKNFWVNISPTLADPALYILTLGLGLGAMVAKIDGRTYIEYIAPGQMIGTALFTSFFEGSYGFYVRMTFEGIYKAMLTTPIEADDVVLGEFFWLACKGAGMSLGVGAVIALFGLWPALHLLPLAPLVGALVALPCGAMGLISCGYAKTIDQFQSHYSFVVAPMFFFSGIFFPTENMPVILQWVASFLPMYHGLKLSQAIAWDVNVIQAFAVHGGVLVLQTILLGLWARKGIRAKLLS